MSQLLSAECLPFAPLDPFSTLLYPALFCESLTCVLSQWVPAPTGFQLASTEGKTDRRESKVLSGYDSPDSFFSNLPQAGGVPPMVVVGSGEGGRILFLSRSLLSMSLSFQVPVAVRPLVPSGLRVEAEPLLLTSGFWTTPMGFSY